MKSGVGCSVGALPAWNTLLLLVFNKYALPYCIAGGLKSRLARQSDGIVTMVPE
jgi:hypothetical protein